MKLREAVPTAHVRASGFVTRSRGCQLEDIRRPLYDVLPEARELAVLRKKLELDLCAAASRLEISAMSLSKLERGHLVPADSKGWGRMLTMLAGGIP